MAGEESAYKRAGLIRAMKAHQTRWDAIFGDPQPQVNDMAFAGWNASGWAHERPDIQQTDNSCTIIFINTEKAVVGHVSLQKLRMFTCRYSSDLIDQYNKVYVSVGDITEPTIDFVIRWIEGRVLDGSKPPTIAFFRDLCHASYFLGIDSVLELSLHKLWFLMRHAAISDSDKSLQEVWDDSIRGSPVLALYSRWYLKCYLIDRRDFATACTTKIHPIAGTWNDDINKLMIESRKSASKKDILEPNLGRIQELANQWITGPLQLIPESKFDWSCRLLPHVQTMGEEAREAEIRRLEEEERQLNEAREAEVQQIPEEEDMNEARKLTLLGHLCTADEGREVRKDIFHKYNNPQLTRMITLEFDEDGITLGVEFLCRISVSLQKTINRQLRVWGGRVALLNVDRSDFEEYLLRWMKGESVFPQGVVYAKLPLLELLKLVHLGNSVKIKEFRDAFLEDVLLRLESGSTVTLEDAIFVYDVSEALPKLRESLKRAIADALIADNELLEEILIDPQFVNRQLLELDIDDRRQGRI